MFGLLLALIYLAFISLGLPDPLLGAGWPAMHVEFGVSVSSMGIVSMIISGGTILSSLFSDALTRRLGTGTVTVVSVFLTVAALFGFSFCTRFWMLLLFAVPYGLGAGAIDAALNSFVALHYKARHMSWLHCFWGVGTIVGPLLMGYALTGGGWSSGYRLVGYVQLAIALLLLCTLPVWKVAGRPQPSGEKPVGLLAAVRERGVPFLLLAFFAYCAAEATAMNWASTYFAEVEGLGAERAASFGALFFVGITAGRFLFGFFTDKLGDARTIVLGSIFLLCGIAVLLLPIPSYLAAVAAFLVIGFGCAPIYPCFIHAAPQLFGKENAGAVIGAQMASAYFGSTFVPPLFGVIGAALGFSVLPVYLFGFVTFMLLMALFAFRFAGRPRAAK